MNNNLSINSITNVLQNRITRPEGVKKRSSVLIPVFNGPSGLELLFCQRSMHLKHQPGDICFPGGRAECGETPLQTALRETQEEIGIFPENIRVLGPTDFVVTPYGVVIYPYMGLIEDMSLSQINLNPDEVESVFTVPLSFFLNTSPKQYYVDVNLDPPENFPYDLIIGGKGYRFGHAKLPELFYEYNNNIIWGLTARITSNACKIIQRGINEIR